MNRNVPSNSARYFRAFIVPPLILSWAWARATIPTSQPAPRESAAHRATSGTAPRRARGGRRPGPRRARPHRRRDARAGPPSASGSGGSVRAAAIRSASALAARASRPTGTAGGAGTGPSRAARPGRAPRRRGSGAIAAGRWAWTIAPMSGRAAWTARWMARSEVGPTTAPRDRPRGRGAPSQTTTRSSALELVLAQAGRRHEDPVGVEPDRDVALAGRDQPARPESAPGAQDGIGRGRRGRSTATSYDGRPRPPIRVPRRASGRPARLPYHRPMPTDAVDGAARPEPRLQGPADEPGDLVARRWGQLHGAAAARPRPDRVGFRDGHRRGPPDDPRPLRRDGRRRHRRPERPEADDVPGRPRAGRR